MPGGGVVWGANAWGGSCCLGAGGIEFSLVSGATTWFSEYLSNPSI